MSRLRLGVAYVLIFTSGPFRPNTRWCTGFSRNQEANVRYTNGEGGSEVVLVPARSGFSHGLAMR